MSVAPRGLPTRFADWLWREPAPEDAWHRRGTSLLRLGFAVARDLASGQLTLRAMSLVYTTLLALVPLLAISFSILKGFGVHNQIEPFLEAALEPLGERAGEITTQIIQFVDNMQVGVLGFVGFVLLFYTVMSLMQKIESAFNEVWQVTRERSMAERFRDYLSVIVVGPVLIFTSLGITASFFATQFVQELLLIGPVGRLVEIAGRLVPVAMVVAAFTFVYAYVPNTRVRFLPALAGGVVAGLLWNMLGIGFAAFIASATRYTAIYSGFATPIFFMIWLYLGWLVLLLGASIAFYRQHPEYLRGRRQAASLSFAEREQIALHALLSIGERFYGDRPAASVEDLTTELQVPTDVVEHLLDVLTDDGLIAPTDQQPPRFLPGCPWEQATLARAMNAVRRARFGSRRARVTGTAGRQQARLPGAVSGAGGYRERPRVRMAVQALDGIAAGAFGGMTLKEFATGPAFPDPAAAGCNDEKEDVP
ncbi:MAG: YihY/virulence factor BrkB family protein [Pseudomonadales bacterium]|nr:YihY/virulence factor BrkB family protein [Pseudomonadales bacterium]